MRFITVQTSTQTRDDAERLARLLVADKLASCVHILRNEVSIYEWKGEVCAEPEYILHIKTRADMWEKVAACLKANHPYETPAIFGWDLPYIEADYAAWVAAQTSA